MTWAVIEEWRPEGIGGEVELRATAEHGEGRLVLARDLHDGHLHLSQLAKLPRTIRQGTK